MNTREDRSLDIPSHHKGWLNLSLGQQHLGDNSQSRPMKVFTCNFCKRKLYSSQALGGHQNAHKRERDAVRRHHQSPKLMVNRSVGIHACKIMWKPVIRVACIEHNK
ncbi:hypothetical protein OSB04_006367 [Centaurea solstitialis]|uniref:C2H2-type domain-containing protein n=1 Tax=Centaurea solstitialis TaxID=347529 RepID=A0AA38U0Y5_9ASTR|nr:hypothetical protein OSB04_006367 [Centaurea solstitialis]